MSTASQEPVKMRSGHQRRRVQLSPSRGNRKAGVGAEVGTEQTLAALSDGAWRSTLDVIVAGGRSLALERLVKSGHVQVRGVIFRQEWRLARKPK